MKLFKKPSYQVKKPFYVHYKNNPFAIFDGILNLKDYFDKKLKNEIGKLDEKVGKLDKKFDALKKEFRIT